MQSRYLIRVYWSLAMAVNVGNKMHSLKKLLNKSIFVVSPIRYYSCYTVLGIETSCDDTGCGIVRSDKQILGQCLISQYEITSRHGGIIPNVARDLHKANIDTVVSTALNEAQIQMNQVDAVAVTNKPGLVMSLLVGLNYAKQICTKFGKPLLPIHHMEAHALVSRLICPELEFPFLTFLISGGHCLLAIVHSVNEFSLLGKCIDDAPGEALDKIARRLKLNNIQKYRSWSGGAAIEDLAKNGNPFAFDLSQPLLQFPDCNFSFSGLKSSLSKIISNEETKSDTAADDILPNVSDICASFQFAIAKHLCVRLQRAIEYVDSRGLLVEGNRSLVISGGVACNLFFNNAFRIVCRERCFNLSVPPPAYCRDNGVMIAWNGVERYHMRHGIYNYDQLSDIIAEPQYPLGIDRTDDVRRAAIKCKWISLDELTNIN